MLQNQSEPTLFKSGDQIYRIYHSYYCPTSPPILHCYTVAAVRAKTYLTTTGERIHKEEALTLAEGKSKYMETVTKLIAELIDGLAALQSTFRGRLRGISGNY